MPSSPRNKGCPHQHVQVAPTTNADVHAAHTAAKKSRRCCLTSGRCSYPAISHLLVLDVYTAWPAAAPAATPVVNTLNGSTEEGLRGCLVQNPGGCHKLLVLPWYMDSCSMGPPMMRPTWSMNRSRYPRAALVACRRHTYGTTCHDQNHHHM